MPVEQVPDYLRETLVEKHFMRLTNFLPPSSQLNADAFRPWEKDRTERRLTLSVPHVVGGRLSGRYVEGAADISYVIQVPNELKALPLKISKKAPMIGVQAPDLLRSITEAYRPRTSVALSEVGDSMFDLRSLAYVVGAAVACGSSGTRFPFVPVGAGVTTLSPTWTVPTSSEVTLGPGVATEDREFVTLSAMAKMAGVTTLQVMGDSVPRGDEAPLQFEALGSYALHVFAYLMASAQSCGCGDHHLEAFFRGMTSVYSLWGHTDEAGWIRGCLKRASYPASSGVLASTAEEIIGLPTRVFIPTSEVTKYALALYLEMAALIPVADARESGSSCVVKARPIQVPPGAPSRFASLMEEFYRVMEEWRDLAVLGYGLHKSLIADSHSALHFFQDDKPDTHLEADVVMPFWWIEPGPLFSGDPGALAMPCKLGGRVSLPLFRSEVVLTPDYPTDYRGAYSPGVPVRLIRKPGGVRSEGASFLLSSAYRKANGLNSAKYVLQPDMGVYTTAALFVEPGVVGAADRRWITPHNPVPSPMEGYTESRSCVEYTYSGMGAEPSVEDWSSAEVVSTLGFFTVNDARIGKLKRVHHTVPDFLRHLTDKYSRFSRWVNSSVHFSEAKGAARPPANIPPAIDASKTLAAPPEPEDAPGEGAPEAVNVTTDNTTTTIPITVPPDRSSAPGDPKLKVEISSKAGARPQLPNVHPESKKQESSPKEPTSESS